MPRLPTAILMLLVFAPCAQAGDELIQNGDFEQGSAGWGKFWSRTGDGQTEIVSTTVHGGQQAAHIQYPGDQGLEFSAGQHPPVQPGDIFELSGWLQTKR